jgi:anti-sigma regulatory factor (Ser/Thr protein kinase)
MPETIVLPGLPSMVPVARHAVRVILEDSPRRDDAELIVSELASNVVLHSRSRCDGGQFRLLVDLKPGWARVEVSDEGPLPAAERDAEARGEFGRGLLVVDAFADRWGHQRTEQAAMYWAELEWTEQP